MSFTRQRGLWAAVICLIALLVVPLRVTGSPSVCDGESGEAHKLCDAYCEVLDCDWDANTSERACNAVKSNYTKLTGRSALPCEEMSLGCAVGDSGIAPPFPFDVGDGNDYGARVHDLTVPEQCQCDGSDCMPCPIVVGFHGYGQTGPGAYSWKSRLEPKGAAVGFISLYPTGDNTTPHSYFGGLKPNWAAPSCMVPEDGCLLEDEIPCDWCGNLNEDNDVSLQREIDFTRAIIKWTMDNHCVDPGQIFAAGYSNGALWSHTLARHPETSGLFKALVPMDGVDQAGVSDHLKWVTPPRDGDAPSILHVNEVFDRTEPYDGMNSADAAAPGVPVWIYSPVLQIFAEYVDKNDGYAACGFGPDDVGDRFGVLDVGGVVPSGYRKLDGPNSLEGEGQEKIHCFTKDAPDASCVKLAICLWDGGESGDDFPDPHGRAGREWSSGKDPGTGGTDPMDIMWRFMQRSVGVPY